MSTSHRKNECTKLLGNQINSRFFRNIKHEHNSRFFSVQSGQKFAYGKFMVLFDEQSRHLGKKYAWLGILPVLCQFHLFCTKKILLLVCFDREGGFFYFVNNFFPSSLVNSKFRSDLRFVNLLKSDRGQMKLQVA